MVEDALLVLRVMEVLRSVAMVDEPKDTELDIKARASPIPAQMMDTLILVLLICQQGSGQWTRGASSHQAEQEAE